MFKIVRIFLLLFTLSLIVILREHKQMLETVVITTTALLVCNFLYIQTMKWIKKFYCVGISHFYLSGLIHQVLFSIVFFIIVFYDYHRLIFSDTIDKYIGLGYVLIIILIDSRKHIFIISKEFVLHKHNFSTIQWQLNSLDKVYVYPHKLEFVKENTKLKVSFDEEEETISEIIEFIRPILGSKLRKKNDSKFHNFE